MSGFITVIFLFLWTRSHYSCADGLVFTANDQKSLCWPYVTQWPSIIEAGTWNMALSAEDRASVYSEIFSPIIREQKFVRNGQQVSWEHKRGGNKGTLPAFLNYTGVSNLLIFTL